MENLPLPRSAGRAQAGGAAVAAAPAVHDLDSSRVAAPITGAGASSSSSSSSSVHPRVSDFSRDGGLGGMRAVSMTMDEPLGSGGGGVGVGQASAADSARVFAATTSGMASGIGGNGGSGKASSLHHPALPPLAHLVHNVSASNSALQSQLRGLDLLSSAFAQLISEVGGSKAHLARLLTRVRDSYRLLFGNLIDTLQAVQSQYESSLHACVGEYKALQMHMDGKVAHLEQRVRLLTSISASKDDMLQLGDAQARTLEAEISELKDGITQGIKTATLKVEQSSNAIIAEGEVNSAAIKRAQEAAALLVAPEQLPADASSWLEPDPDELESNIVHDPDAPTFATASSVDALTQLSLESRNLSLELSELIQTVEVQSNKSALALQGLDRLLDQGARTDVVQALAADAAFNVAVAATTATTLVAVAPASDGSTSTAGSSAAATAAASLAAVSTPALAAPAPAASTVSSSSSSSFSSSSSSCSTSASSSSLSVRPSSAVLGSSSRWQYLRHMTEHTALEESQRTIATQTEQSMDTANHAPALMQAQQTQADTNNKTQPP